MANAEPDASPRVFELCFGPTMHGPIILAPEIRCFPLPNVGVHNIVGAVSSFLTQLGLSASVQATAEFQQVASSYQPAVVFEWKPGQSQAWTSSEALMSDGKAELSHARKVAGLSFGDAYTPFATLSWLNGDDVTIKVSFPRVRGFGFEGDWTALFGTDEWSSTAEKVKDVAQNPRSSILLSIYEAASQIEDVTYRIAQLYVCLGAISAGITRALGDGKERDAIRMALGYGYGKPFPIFQVEGKDCISFDHIAVAALVRNMVFHGGSLREPSNGKDGVGIRLFRENPELLATALTKDCLELLHGWFNGSPARRAEDGSFSPPAWVDAPTGPRWHFVCRADVPERCVGALVEVGAHRVLLRLLCQTVPMSPADRAHVVARLGGGSILDGLPLGYEFRFGTLSG